MHKIFVIFLICTGQYALAIRIQNLPCFIDEYLKDLEDTRKELTTVDNYIEKNVKILADEFKKTLNSIKNQLVTLQTNVSKIVQKVDTDLILMSKDLEGSGYWIGLTVLIEGEWRWSVDQSLAAFKTWFSGYGAKGHNDNCVSFAGSLLTWFDTSCKTDRYYICERNFCY